MPIKANNVEYESVPDDVRESFSKYAWCDEIFNDESLRPVKTNWDMDAPGAPSTFMRHSLRSHGAILGVQSFYRSADAGADAGADTSSSKDELLTLYSVGPGSQSQTGIAHGGFFAALFDQQMGSWAKMHSQLGMPHTVYLNISYKAPLYTPSAVLVRAWITSIEGRKIKFSAAIEREGGAKIALAEALFISGAKL